MPKQRPTSTQRRRLLLVVRHPVGGIRTYLRYVYNQSEFRNYEIKILVCADADGAKSLAKQLHLANARIEYCGGSNLAFLLAVVRRVFGGDYQIVHSHGMTAGLFVAMSARLRGRKHVLTLHGVFEPNQFGGIKGRLIKTSISLSLLLVNVIQPVSDGCRQNLLAVLPLLRFRRKSIVTILNGIPVQQFAGTAKIDLHEHLDIAADKLLLGFLGRFMPEKGFAFIIDAVATLQSDPTYSDRFVVVAFGSGDYLRETAREVERRGLVDWICFSPFIDDVAPVIASLDAILMPSLWEACPLLPMESLVCGTPVIATKCIGLAEVINGSPTITIPENDGAAVARAIRKFIGDDVGPAFREYRDTAHSRFDVARTAEALRGLYDKLLPSG